MDNYKYNCIVFRTILGSYLSDINKVKPLWYYDILYLKKKKKKEEEEECSLSFDEFENW